MKKANLMALSVLIAGGLFASFSAQAQNLPDDVLKVLKANKDLSKFLDLVDDAGIEGDLSNKDSKLTIFVPNNAAMDKLPSDVLKRAKEGKDGIKKLVQYHVINGSAVFAGNIKGRRASPSTASGEMMGFDGTGKDLKVNNAVIVMPNQSAKNGVVHVINAVLVPPSLEDPKIKEAARAKEEARMKEEMDERMKEREVRQKEMEAKRAKDEPAPATESAPEAVKEGVAEPVAPMTPAVAAPTAPKAPGVVAAPEKKEEKSLWNKLLGK